MRISTARLARGVVVWGVAALLVLPLAWMVSSSLKTPQQVFAEDSPWIPDPVVLSNYARAFQDMPVLLYARNTLWITFFCVLGYIVSGSLAAYAFARLRWPGRDTWFVILLATMMLPPQVTIVPLFVIFRWLGWIDTHLPLIVPAWLSGWPFFIFLLRQFFLTIPRDISEAAVVDGAGHLRIYASIMLPLERPALATVAIFGFLLHWNDFFGPLIFLADDSRFTLALGLMTFASRHPGDFGALMAASIVMLVPTIIVFFFCQRYFIEGITIGGSKG
jgi:ABC-type glycerol-3-phosphate transport system permease component